MLGFFDSRSIAMEPHQLGDSLAALERIVGAAKEVLGDFAPACEIVVELDHAHVDRNASKAGADDSVAAGAGELPPGTKSANIDGMDLPVALHRLADCGRPGRVDRPQPIAEDDLVRIERDDVAWVHRRKRSRGRHV
jgi:hypothetical protein